MLSSNGESTQNSDASSQPGRRHRGMGRRGQLSEFSSLCVIPWGCGRGWLRTAWRGLCSGSTTARRWALPAYGLGSLIVALWLIKAWVDLRVNDWTGRFTMSSRVRSPSTTRPT